jgi:hypothetical protein
MERTPRTYRFTATVFLHRQKSMIDIKYAFIDVIGVDTRKG